MLNDKRNYKAEVIGTDPSTDLALLRIKEKNLPFIGYGNSDNIKIGEWVLAVGNPFNLNSTVTAGIISAKRLGNIIEGNRGSGQFPIESFIQTDAAINPGNSGGALVNTDGELVGINTAIMSSNGAYQGYAFAIPVNIVKKVVSDRSGGFPGDPGRNLLAIMKWLTFQGMPNLAGVQGSGRFVAHAPWTLAYEWLFYFSLPLLALVCGAARSLSMPTFAAPLVIATVGTIVSPIAFGGWRLSFVLPFALGMLAIELTRRPQVAGLLRMPAWAWIGVASLGLAMTQFPTAFESTPQIILFVFFLTVAAGNTYFGILSHPTSLVLGGASYSIYLLHGLVLSLFMGELLCPASGRPDTFIWVALPVLATVVCTVSAQKAA